MPESKGRKPKKNAKSKKKAKAASGHGNDSASSLRLRPSYAPGKLAGSEAAVAGLLDSDSTAPDQLVELLLPLLWLAHNTGMPGNLCVDGSMVLHHAYAQFGIIAEPRPVDVVISNQRTGRRTLYGRPDPYWDGHTFHGHCLLHLTGSGRTVDATVEQYPEVRRLRLGPIIGRSVMSVPGSFADSAAMSRGELLDNSHIAVQRQDLMLLYTTTGAEYRNTVTTSPLVRETTPRYRRAGINLASHALTMLRIPEVAAKVRHAPYPRVHALLDAIGTAEFTIDSPSGDFRFAMPVDDGEMSLRLDDISLPEASAAPARTETPQGAAPEVSTQPEHIQEVLNDVDTEARAVTTPTAAMGEGAAPTVLVEPRRAIAMQSNGQTSEIQAEMIIAHGFARFHPSWSDPPPLLSAWSLCRTVSGVELWDEGGIWARAQLAPGHAWLDAAAAIGAVQVIYGVRIGVRVPLGRSYGDAEREHELHTSRREGIVAIATIPWHG